jgi:hypothetical protein
MSRWVPWILLARESPPRIEAGRWREQAKALLGINLDAGDHSRVVLADEQLRVRIAGHRDVLVSARPIGACEAERQRAWRAVAAIGGAGFDALVAAAKTVWFVAPEDGDARAALSVCAVLAMVLLAPIVPPEGDAIFGYRGARARMT